MTMQEIGFVRSERDPQWTADRTGPLPLSEGQRQLWFLNRLAPDSAEYLVPLVLRLRGVLNEDALRRVWTELVARHEILRTRYELHGDQPIQVIDPPAAPRWAVADLTHVAAAEREDAALALAAHETRLPFDLEHDHPLRLTLVRLAADDHLLVATFHHVASDQVSQQVLLGELGALYHAFSAGLPSPLPEPEVQYADFAVWQQKRLSDDRVERDLRYWRAQLAGVPRLELPTDLPRPAVRGWHGAAVEIVVPAATAKSLRELAIAGRATPFMALLTAFQVLLARYSGQDDITVGTVVSGRTDPRLAGTVGYLINNLVLRTRIDGAPSFTDLLTTVRNTVLDAFDHQDVPFARLVDDLQPERDMSVTPLFQAAITMHDLPPGEVEVAGLRIEHADLAWNVAKVDLGLRLAELPDGSIGAVFEYATDLFTAETITRMADHFVRLLDAIAAAPEASVRSLDLLGEAERELLTSGSGVQVPLPDRCLHEVFAEQVARTPDAPAVAFEGEVLSYAELNARANRLAHHLLELGAGPGKLVGVCLDRDGELVPALLGVTKSGAGYLPLDPAYPADRLGFMLADAEVEVVVTTSRHLPALAAVHSGLVVVVDTDADALAARPDTDPEVVSTPDDLAYVIYTSGSTGRPKGVCVTHANVLRLFTSSDRYFGFDEHDAWSMFHSYSFDVSVWELWGALLHGGKLVVVSFDVSRSPEDFCALLVDNGVTILSQTPSAFRGLVTLAENDPGRLAGLRLRAVVFAGEKLELADLAPWITRFGLAEPALVNMYGITETTVHSTFHRVTETDLAPNAGNPIGYPLDDLRIHLLDQHGELVPIGVPGEIHVGGPGVTRGYLKRPELTAQRFLDDPYAPGAKLYRSGDLARRLPDGSLQFLGRIDHQVKLRGFRIELGEITAALAEHPGVREAVVVLREDSPGDRRLVAYVVPAGEEAPDPGELRAVAGGRLPDYMVPSAFVTIGAIPLTPNGKLDQRALPAPDESAMRARGEIVAPRTVTEARLAAVWRDVLDVETVSVHDGFFDLGGDSIRAVSLVGSLRAEGFAVSVRDVFEHRTVARLADHLEQQTAPAPEEPPVERFALISPEDRALLGPGVTDAYPMSQLQMIMLIEMMASGDTNLYHNVSSFKVKDPNTFDYDALLEAGRLLVARHEILRTSLHPEAFSVPMQVVHAHAEMEIGTRDLRGMDRASAEAAIRQWTLEERERRFDVGRPALLRYFAHVVDDGWWVSITECHPILEGWSYHSLLMQLLGAYFELSAGRPAPVEPPTPAVRYADFVAAEQKSVASVEDRGYWRDVVTRFPAFELPSAWRGEEPAERYRLDLSCRDIMDSLRDIARRADVSVKAVLHSAYLKVMSTLTDSEEFFTGLVCDTRPEVLGADRVAGMYLNTLPFSYDRSAKTWRDLVKQTFAKHVELWPHRRFPLPEIHREAGATGRLIDTFFIYLDFHVVDADLVEPDTVMDDSPNEFALTIANMRDVLLLHTNTSVLSKANGERLMAMFRAVLEAMIADLDGDAQATYLPPGERALVLAQWNRTERELSARGVVERVRDFAERTPEKIAVVDRDEWVTYRTLAGRASVVSARLAGLPRGSVVPVLADSGVGFVSAVLGVIGAGCAYIPLDTAAPVPRTAKLLADSGARVVLAAPQHVEHARAAVAGLPVDVLVMVPAGHTRAEWSTPIGDENDLAYVIYTSGSTGMPKGAMVHRRGMANHLLAKVEDLALTADDIVVQNAPLTFDVSVWQMLAPLVVGGTVHVVDRSAAADPAALFGAVTFEAATVLEVVPSLLRAALDDWEAGAPLPDLTSLRWLMVTGEALPPELCTRWFALFPHVPMVNAYGPTECSDDVTHAFLDAATPIEGPIVPIGKAIRNTKLYVLDPNRMPVPVGIPGELHVAGAGVGRGYLNDPERTAQAFVEDPFGGGLMYRTGDRVRYRTDGQLEFIGRRDNQVKIRGQRVELGEVESALRACPGVTDAAAKVHAGSLVGYFAGPADPAEIRRLLTAALPEHLVPSALVELPVLPLTANGKVDRKALPAPDRSALGAGEIVAPRTPAEARLVEVWRTVLGVDEIGVEDDFFAVGGDSIRTLTLVSAMRANGFRLTVRDVFAHRTIAGLAAQDGASDEEKALVWLRPGEGKPAVYCVHPQGGSAHWFVPLADAVGDDCAVAAFEAPVSLGERTIDLRELAGRYIGEMADGPRILLGWSSAATLAWEMAAQLAAAGTPAAAVVLVDPTGDPAGLSGVVTTDPVVERLVELMTNGAAVTDDEVAVLLGLARLSGAESDRETVRLQLNRMRMLTKAMYSYHYPVIETPVLLLATDDCAERGHGVLRGRLYPEYVQHWTELAVGGLDVRRVSGGHEDVLAAARVPELAAVLREVIGQLSTEDSGR
ncbi:amino acid adenylation domain-containing protein [Lentzea sp. NEAU-D13]|uniref:Amino acid adenylation domain-containing protein n=1 Tax=Lentzea alba TaxID=2714351 RepID=A0A7C9RUN1_9PSEU|nr:non-ribosomal peptide synthetase [Lentzea alba]NGY63288.1 amino acid adenylation domain-containing protein [Lentzea alba]